ncbi:hypothetical protein GW17_00000905 [Ensete ventricosum]|nr:hypothetical protein GW17_00000905 [Ensete ventricosum]
MPAWWKGKSKSKSKSTASPRTKEPVTPRTPRAAATTVLPDEELVAVTRHGTKEKVNSFDEVLGSRKSGDLSLVGGGGLGAGTGFVFGHPLPLPTSISSYGVSTGSASSVSSSSSSEETPDLGLYSRRTASPSPGLTGHHPFPASPVHPSSFGLCSASPNRRQDNLRSSPQPLPLPPSSPTCSSASPSSCSSSSSSRSPKSLWKKGKLLGRGTFGHVYLGFNRILDYPISHFKCTCCSGSGQMCAIKEVKDISDDANSKECLKQLNQEYGPFGESLTRNYTAQILSGLAYLHGRKTVHSLIVKR